MTEPAASFSTRALRPQHGLSATLPALFTPTDAASRRYIEFFTAHIRNPNTRKAYARAATEFSAWCTEHRLTELAAIEPVHVAAYVETLQARLSAPSVKLHLAGIRMLFDWLVVGQVVPSNPASSVRGPRHSVKRALRLCSPPRRRARCWHPSAMDQPSTCATVRSSR